METLRMVDKGIVLPRLHEAGVPGHSAIETYRELRPLYVDFSETLKMILEEELARRAIGVHSVEARAKSIESFDNKVATLYDGGKRNASPPDPFKEITDMAGIRVITFFPKTISDVDRLIQDEFIITEKDDKLEILRGKCSFGYQSIHYLIKLKPNRTSLGEYGKYKDLMAEVQVRTILQHAWAEIEHDIQYKSLRSMPPEIRRRFMALSGLLEMADREFQAIHDEDERLRCVKKVER